MKIAKEIPLVNQWNHQEEEAEKEQGQAAAAEVGATQEAPFIKILSDHMTKVCVSLFAFIQIVLYLYLVVDFQQA